MPIQPIVVTLSDGQMMETLKRFRAKYAEELEKLDVELTDILTALAEADFIAQYLGEQPEVKELRAKKAELEVKERRRDYLGKIIDRLDASIPQLPAVSVPVPNSGRPEAGGSGGAKQLRRY